MFFLRWPDDERVRALLRDVSTADFTHSHVGTTRADLEDAPAGYVLDRYGAPLGRGESVFDAARSALRDFANYPASFTRAIRLEETFEAGTVFGTVATHFGFASMNPCRIAFVVDEAEAGRFGFGLGTLPGHAAAGEERFLLTLDPESGLVHYEVQAISKPAVWLARFGRPAMRLVQGRFRRESCEAMRRLAQGG